MRTHSLGLFAAILASCAPVALPGDPAPTGGSTPTGAEDLPPQVAEGTSPSSPTSPTDLSSTTPPVDTGAPEEPVDCSLFASMPGKDLCASSDARCEVTYTDGAGCEAVCAAAGLSCAGAYDNVDGACLADLSSPLSCTTGHASDYCLCDGPQEPVDPCASYPLPQATLMAELAGFGRHTRGGDYGTLYRVTTLADDGPGSLREGLESPTSQWIVFDVEGEITWIPASRWPRTRRWTGATATSPSAGTCSSPTPTTSSSPTSSSPTTSRGTAPRPAT